MSEQPKEFWEKIHQDHFSHLNMNGHWDRFLSTGAKRDPEFKLCGSGVAMKIRYDWGTIEWVSLGELMRTGAFANSFAGFVARHKRVTQ